MDKPGTYGEDLFWAYPDYTQNQTKRYFTPGQWHSVKTRIIINTPGEFDGRVTSWFDGGLGLDSVVRYRAEGNTTFAVDKFLFSTFFGGGDDTWATTKDEYIYFDDFIISETNPALSTAVEKLSESQKRPFHLVRGDKSMLIELAPSKEKRTLAICDVKGREITTIEEVNNSFYWDHQGISCGFYFLLLNGQLLSRVELH